MWLWACVALLIGAGVPAAIIGMIGEPLRRLVGLQLLSALVVLVTMAFGQATGQTSSFLSVALVAVVLSFAGGLVFARLMAPRR